jgi:hypothetical protein
MRERNSVRFVKRAGEGGSPVHEGRVGAFLSLFKLKWRMDV